MSEIFFPKSKTSYSKEELENLKKVGDVIYKNLKKSYEDTNHHLYSDFKFNPRMIDDKIVSIDIIKDK